MYLNIILIPLISAITAGLFGRYLGSKGAGIFTTISIGITSLLSWKLFYKVGLGGSPVWITMAKWMESDYLDLSFGICIDSLTVSMLILVTTVSTLVHLYSTGYMSEDPHLPRFMSYLSLFTMFMIILVTADNLVQLFIGWEGVGLCSYLLINFWFTRIEANKSAINAMVVNRIGDLGLTLGILATFYTFGAIDLATIFALAPSSKFETTTFLNMEVNNLTLICTLFLIGAIGKSAQLGLHIWLPQAMEGENFYNINLVQITNYINIRSINILNYDLNNYTNNQLFLKDFSFMNYYSGNFVELSSKIKIRKYGTKMFSNISIVELYFFNILRKRSYRWIIIIWWFFRKIL